MKNNKRIRTSCESLDAEITVHLIRKVRDSVRIRTLYAVFVDL